MPRSLSEGQQRLVFGALVVVLVAFGIYLSLGGWSDGSGDDAASSGAASEPPAVGGEQASGTGDVAPPSPIPTTAAQDMPVMEWFPFSEEEFKAAAATAQEFGRSYGTIDYSGSPEDYYAGMQELATDDYAQTLAESSGASALWQDMADQEAVSEGRANVESVRTFGDDSVTFVVQVQSITEGEDGTTDDLGEFAVTVADQGGEWRVYDFQPSDAGNLGDVPDQPGDSAGD
ncbi:hypothetical protein [Streptomonospora salina]|uniref:Uncharacterized protein n=1 Tax=Streptomonospora salina TaxID=104205 RepID=A0A841EGA0_9ACTN|nr:hypothetical protein [Streptomonospora salina]MBB5999430.1 hypothetical protein [Streptomonospora salina]